MEDECSSLSWEFYYQEEGLEELEHSLLYTTLELEATIVSAKEEIRRRDCELVQLNDALNRVIKERDEAQAQCQKLVLEKLELQQQLQQNHQSKDNIVSQNDQDELILQAQGAASSSESESDSDEQHKALVLPEKGKLLKAVVEAGPLLQTLLLAGPLPQWQHPPPLAPIQIPPLIISSPNDFNNTTFSSFSHKSDLDPYCPLNPPLVQSLQTSFATDISKV